MRPAILDRVTARFQILHAVIKWHDPRNLLAHLPARFATEKLRSLRGYVIVGAFVVGAIFTPPDVVSQVMLAVPLWLLYELGLLVARFVAVSKPGTDVQESEAA